MPKNIEPTEQMLDLKRKLLLLPKNKRKAVLENGIKMAKLKAEREALLKQEAMKNGYPRKLHEVFGDSFALAGQTEAEVRAQEAERKAEEERTKREAAEAELKKKEAELQAEVRQRSAAAAETFELGQDAMDNLSGQGGLSMAILMVAASCRLWKPDRQVPVTRSRMRWMMGSMR